VFDEVVDCFVPKKDTYLVTDTKEDNRIVGTNLPSY